MTSPLLLSHHADGVLTLTLNRADKLNALNVEMYAALASALAAAQTDAQTRVVVIAGDGKAFCAGNDLADFLTARPAGEPSPAMGLLDQLAQRSKPLIAAVQGAAVGIGATILLHCDMVLAAPSALITFPFMALGLIPEAASTLLLPRMVGHARAMELFMLCQPCPAARAAEIGLVNQVVAEEALLATTQALAARVAQHPAEALAALIRLARPPVAQMQAQIADESVVFAELLQGPVAQGRMRAFLAGRTR